MSGPGYKADAAGAAEETNADGCHTSGLSRSQGLRATVWPNSREVCPTWGWLSGRARFSRYVSELHRGTIRRPPKCHFSDSYVQPIATPIANTLERRGKPGNTTSTSAPAHTYAASQMAVPGRSCQQPCHCGRLGKPRMWPDVDLTPHPGAGILYARHNRARLRVFWKLPMASTGLRARGFSSPAAEA